MKSKHRNAQRLPLEFLTRGIFPCLLLAMLAFLSYSTSLHGQFVFDDDHVIFQNADLLNVRTIGQALELNGYGGWRKALNVTYALNFYFGGLDPFGYHLVNVALHALNSIIIFYVLLEIGASRRSSLAGAAVFAVHPLATGAASYIAGRSALLAGTFYFLAFLVFLKGLHSSRLLLRILYFLAASAAFVLAFSAKEEAITLPGFMAAYLWIRSAGKRWYYLFLLLIPAAAAYWMWDRLAGGLAELASNKYLAPVGYDAAPPLAVYVQTYISAVVTYVLPKFLWPAGLNIDPDIPIVVHWYSPAFVFPLCVIAAMSGVAFFMRSPKTLLLRTGLAAILVSPLAAHMVVAEADVIQDHRLYIAAFSIAFISAWLAEWLFTRFGKRAAWGVAVAVIVLGFATLDRNRAWASGVSLWEDAVRKSPEKPRPHINLGLAYQNAGRVPEALAQYQITARLRPGLADANMNIGLAYLQQGNLDRAKQVFERLRETAPSFVEGWSNLGMVYVHMREPDKALEILNPALKQNPQSPAALFSRGDAFALKGEYTQAISDYRAALALRPNAGMVRLRLGAIYLHANERAAAEKEFQTLSTDPVIAPDALRNLGIMKSDAGDYNSALAYFEQALRRKPLFPEVYHDRGVVFLRMHLSDRAIEQFKLALLEKPDFEAAVVALSEVYAQNGNATLARQVLDEYMQKSGVKTVNRREAVQ